MQDAGGTPTLRSGTTQPTIRSGCTRQLCPQRLVLPQERLAPLRRERLAVLAERVAVVAGVVQKLEQLVIRIDPLGVLLQVVDVAGADPRLQQREALRQRAVLHFA